MARWVFEVPQGSMSKWAAWRRCVRSGLRVGIPAHAWLKNHGQGFWRYHTDTDERIEMRGRAAARRRGDA